MAPMVSLYSSQWSVPLSVCGQQTLPTLMAVMDDDDDDDEVPPSEEALTAVGVTVQ